MQASNTSPQETVKGLYDSFVKGDVAAIVDKVSDDFTWEDSCDPSVVPYGGFHKTRQGFLEFFKKLNESIETNVWEVNEYVSEGDIVVALGKHGFRHRKTGKTAVADFVMVWRFKDGRPASGRSFYNAALIEPAFS